KHQFRRKIALVGTNDGQWHAFDAGTVIKSTDPSKLFFNNGSGLESFGIIPRLALPIIRDDAEGSAHIFGMDGPITAGDAYFYGDSQWHTIAVGGSREGGRKLGGGLVAEPEPGGTGSAPIRGGYLAIDITQPDPLVTLTDSNGHILNFLPQNGATSVTDDPSTWAVPGCTSLDGSTPAGCPRPFPKLLWEFTDRCLTGCVRVTAPLVSTGAFLDENRTVPGTGSPSSAPNASGDLGNPWSK